MNTKESKLLMETYQYVIDNQQKNYFYANVYNKFMNEAANKTLQGFEEWFKSRLEENKLVWNDEMLQKHYATLEEQKLLPTSTDAIYEELCKHVASKIINDQRVYSSFYSC